MPAVLIAAAYRFVELHDGPVLRVSLFNSAQQAGLKGTLLLAPEGINFTLAGEPDALHAWMHTLRQDPRFEPLKSKLSHADAVPFRHLRVKLKAEIIRMNQPAVQPHAGRAPAVSAQTLARWLQNGHCDEGRPLLLLDTRNGFEVEAGAFEGAVHWQLQRFSDFPAALAAHRSELQGKTVVSYCTGGIRCEKAALWMAASGLPHVLQLDGGILQYFAGTAQLGAARGWRGHCVVFDERSELDTQLAPAAPQVSPAIAA